MESDSFIIRSGENFYQEKLQFYHLGEGWKVTVLSLGRGGNCFITLVTSRKIKTLVGVKGDGFITVAMGGKMKKGLPHSSVLYHLLGLPF